MQAALRRHDLVDHLLLALSEDDFQNRRTRRHHPGLAQGAARATRALIEALREPALQEYVTHALVSIGFQDREPYGRACSMPDDAVRQGTIRCLAWIAPPDAIALVAPLIHDPSQEVRAEAVAAIGRLGDEDAAMLLFELLADESELIQESAMGALARLPPDQRGAAAAAGAGQRRHRRAHPRRARRWACCATPVGARAGGASRATRARTCGAPPSRRWARWTRPTWRRC